MLVALMAHDKPGGLDLRLATRDAHRAYLAASPEVAQAGPLLDEAGRMIGSLLILDVPDMAEAEAWAAKDPYAEAGLFTSLSLTQWNRVVG